MSTDTQQIVSKAWNFAHVLRDEPAAKLLERIKATRRETPEPATSRKRRTPRRDGS